MRALKRTWSKQGLLQHSVPGDRVRGQCAQLPLLTVPLWFLVPSLTHTPCHVWNWEQGPLVDLGMSGRASEKLLPRLMPGWLGLAFR